MVKSLHGICFFFFLFFFPTAERTVMYNICIQRFVETQPQSDVEYISVLSVTTETQRRHFRRNPWKLIKTRLIKTSYFDKIMKDNKFYNNLCRVVFAGCDKNPSSILLFGDKYTNHVAARHRLYSKLKRTTHLSVITSMYTSTSNLIINNPINNYLLV